MSDNAPAAQTAAEALALYRDALAAGTLIQGRFHWYGDDGRNLACALGVLGPKIEDASDCPAQVMPRWLAQMVPWFFDNQDRTDAFAWGEAFYAQLARRLHPVVVDPPKLVVGAHGLSEPQGDRAHLLDIGSADAILHRPADRRA